MPHCRTWPSVPTVEIGGVVVEVLGISIDPGNDIKIGFDAANFKDVFMLRGSSPTITLEGCSICDYAMHETNSLRVVFQKRKRWKFPTERFVTYEDSDEEWCRYFGIGHEVEYTPVIEMQNALVEAADYDTVRFVGTAEQKNVDVTP
jgi:hypothetical protein